MPPFLLSGSVICIRDLFVHRSLHKVLICHRERFERRYLHKRLICHLMKLRFSLNLMDLLVLYRLPVGQLDLTLANKFSSRA